MTKTKNTLVYTQPVSLVLLFKCIYIYTSMLLIILTRKAKHLEVEKLLTQTPL